MTTNISYRISVGILSALARLPLEVLYVFSDIAYFIIYYAVRYRRKTVRHNLELVFGSSGHSNIIRIEKKFYRHLCDCIAETVKLLHISDEEIDRRAVVTNGEYIDGIIRSGHSVVLLLGHYGNWEWLSSCGLWEKEADFLVLYKPIRNRVVNRMTYAIRSHFGAIPVDRKDALRTIARYRSEGRLFLAGFIGDQTPNQWNLNFWTEFLHQDTPVLLGTERIATKYNLPVVSVRMRKVRRGYYEVEFVDVCAHPKELETGELTRRHTRLLESFIREEPEFWLWSHRRWKHKRVDNVK